VWHALSVCGGPSPAGLMRKCAAEHRITTAGTTAHRAKRFRPAWLGVRKSLCSPAFDARDPKRWALTTLPFHISFALVHRDFVNRWESPARHCSDGSQNVSNLRPACDRIRATVHDEIGAAANNVSPRFSSLPCPKIPGSSPRIPGLAFTGNLPITH
jgi:hypothetical protein